MQFAKVWLVVRIYLFLYKARFFAAMGKLTLLLFTVVTLFGCGNGRNDRNNKEVQKADNQSNGKTDTSSANSSSNKLQSWSKADQKKFIDECKDGHEGEDMAPEKIDELCACMLTEAQKYYSSYKRINDSANEDHDWEIVEKCREHYPEQDQ